MDTNHYYSTGEAARHLDTTEPRLAEAVRRGKIHPEPRIIAGRRLWTIPQLFQAAVALNVLTPELRARLRALAGAQEGAGAS